MIKDLTNRQFDRLFVVSFYDIAPGGARWLCRCDCGTEKIVRGNNLTSKAVKSCGCLAKEGHPTHGDSKSRLYRIWYGIIRRIEDSSRKEHKNYGACGIRMCKVWRDSFETFREWALQNGYTDEKALVREDKTVDYIPENCSFSKYHKNYNTDQNHETPA